MAITYTAAGTEVATTTTTLTMGAPAALSGDILFALIYSNNNTALTPLQTGWNLLYDTANTSTMQTYLAWKRAGVNDSLANFDWTVAGTTVSFGVIVGYRGAISAGTPIGSKSISNNASADNVTWATLNPVGLNHLIAFGTYADDLTTSGTFSGTNPTFTERVDVETATGADASIFIWDGPILTLAASGSRTLDSASTADGVNQGIMVELLPLVQASYNDAGSSPTYARVERRVRF